MSPPTKHNRDGDHHGRSRHYQEILMRVTPPPGLYQKYAQQTDRYLEKLLKTEFRIRYRSHSHVGVVTDVGFTKSILFHEPYLVVYMDAEWYRKVLPSSDAVATTHPWPEMPLRTLPFVMVPDDHKSPWNRRFQGIFEHECVHINQYLLDQDAKLPQRGRAADLVKSFAQRVRNEYEAVYLTVVRWPKLGESIPGHGVELVCTLRGLIAGLETMMDHLPTMKIEGREITKALDRLQKGFPNLLRSFGGHEPLSPWFEKRFVAHVGVALTDASLRFPQFEANKSYQAVIHWIASQQKDCVCSPADVVQWVKTERTKKLGGQRGS